MNNTIIITDFDGTVTLTDTIKSFLDKYANSKWLEIEQEWLDGYINSQECLKQQLELVSKFSDEELNYFLLRVPIDKSFSKLCKFAQFNKTKVVIVSDGFDLFINTILEHNDIFNVKVYSNHLELVNGEFKVSFPNKNLRCKINAGTCKCAIVEHYKNLYERVIYFGDGESDFCVCEKPDLLFAKGVLAQHCDDINLEYIKFNTFEEVIKNDRFGLIV